MSTIYYQKVCKFQCMENAKWIFILSFHGECFIIDWKQLKSPLTSLRVVEKPPSSFPAKTLVPPGTVPTSKVRMTLLLSSSASRNTVNSGSVWSRPTSWSTPHSPSFVSPWDWNQLIQHSISIGIQFIAVYQCTLCTDTLNLRYN